MKELIVFRGIPGSGKTTAARTLQRALIEDGYTTALYEADMFFMDEHDNYNWDPKLIGTAHRWCENQVINALKNCDKVIVSNTNLELRDMMKWQGIAHQANARMVVYRMENRYQNVHRVPDQTISNMKNKMKDWRGEIILRSNYVYATDRLLNLKRK